MPTYEYQCGKCGHRFEVFQRIVDPPVRDCPKCGTKVIERDSYTILKNRIKNSRCTVCKAKIDGVFED